MGYLPNAVIGTSIAPNWSGEGTRAQFRVGGHPGCRSLESTPLRGVQCSPAGPSSEVCLLSAEHSVDGESLGGDTEEMNRASHSRVAARKAGTPMNDAAREACRRTMLLGCFALTAVLSLTLVGCHGSSDALNTSAAEFLPSGESYVGPPMVTPRYGHTATTLTDGKILIVGGSDERHLTSLDTAEIFDQSGQVDILTPVPQSLSGNFYDQDINGDIMTMNNGGRIFHTATLLPDGSVMICGGASDMLFAEAIAVSEIFDTQSREFAPGFLEIVQDLLVPRFRHSATLMPNGKVLIAGGQESRNETIIDPTQPPGSPNFQITINVFPSLESVEIFDPASLSFSAALTVLGQDTELATPRGRAGHSTSALAGYDNLLGTNDDVLIHVGGFETLSSIFAPQFKAPWQADTTKMSGLETYDIANGVNTLGQGVVLSARVNDAHLINAGRFNPLTPPFDVNDDGLIDGGIAGVNNVILIANGDGDGSCPVSVVQNELLVATFSGFGPSNGLLLSLLSGEFTLLNNNELIFFDPMNCGPFGRSEADMVSMTVERTYDGMVYQTGVAVTGGGAWIFIPPTGGCAEAMAGVCANEIQGFMFYDPFFNVIPCAIDPVNPPFQPWDLTVNTSPINPTGVIGTILNFDDAIADQTCFDENADGFDDNYGDGSFLLALIQAKVLHTLSRVPGENGVINDLDDRIVAIGGGSSYFPNYGDEPVTISCEVIVLPDTTQPLPNPGP